jgi:hypothetical protein
MFFRDADADDIPVTSLHQLLLFVSAVVIIVLGIFPDLLLNLGSVTISSIAAK